MSDERCDFTKGLLIGTLMGALIGAVLGILYAPKSGGETREEMAARTREIADLFRDECGKALQKSKASYESVIHQLKEQESNVGKRIERLLKKVGD
jgi:gas vesicle protein